MFQQIRGFLLYIFILALALSTGLVFCENREFMGFWYIYIYHPILLLHPLACGVFFAYHLKKKFPLAISRIFLIGLLAFVLYGLLCWLPWLLMKDRFMIWSDDKNYKQFYTIIPPIILIVTFLTTALFVKYEPGKKVFSSYKVLLPLIVYLVIDAVLLALGLYWENPLGYDPNRNNDDLHFKWELYIYTTSCIPILPAVLVAKWTRKKYNPSFSEALLLSLIGFIGVKLVISIPEASYLFESVLFCFPSIRILNSVEFLLPTHLFSSFFFSFFYVIYFLAIRLLEQDKKKLRERREKYDGRF